MFAQSRPLFQLLIKYLYCKSIESGANNNSLDVQILNSTRIRPVVPGVLKLLFFLEIKRSQFSKSFTILSVTSRNTLCDCQCRLSVCPYSLVSSCRQAGFDLRLLYINLHTSWQNYRRQQIK